MPGYDRTGPLGQGSMTGRGMGRCGGGAIGIGRGAGGGGFGGFLGRCRGGRFGGFGRGFGGGGAGYAWGGSALPANDDEAMRRRLEDIEAEAQEIRKRLGK